jgi:hypothetical protein
MGLWDWLFGADPKTEAKDKKRKEKRDVEVQKEKAQNLAGRSASLLKTLEANLASVEKENCARIDKDRKTLERLRQLKAVECAKCKAPSLPVLGNPSGYLCAKCGAFAGAWHDLREVGVAMAGDAKSRLEGTQRLIQRVKDGLHVSEEEMKNVCLDNMTA